MVLQVDGIDQQMHLDVASLLSCAVARRGYLGIHTRTRDMSFLDVQRLCDVVVCAADRHFSWSSFIALRSEGDDGSFFHCGCLRISRIAVSPSISAS